jgi:hypothetical protein
LVREVVLMRKVFPAAAFVSVLLLFTVAGTQIVKLGSANPYHFRLMGEVPPDANTKPPTITIFSPENNTLYNRDSVDLYLNVSVGNSTTAASCFLWDVYYETDWQSDSTYVYERIPETNQPLLAEFSEAVNMTGIPDGEHTITVFVTERGSYEESDPGSAGFVTLYYPFKITGSSSVGFTIDTVAPEVTVFSPENAVYDTPDVPLNFTVSESTSSFSYVLDGQKNVTIGGNTTLSGLSNGKHNVTVYARDAAGNIGVSETISFSVELPFPTAMVAASTASVAAISIGFLLYFKKRKH